MARDALVQVDRRVDADLAHGIGRDERAIDAPSWTSPVPVPLRSVAGSQPPWREPHAPGRRREASRSGARGFQNKDRGGNMIRIAASGRRPPSSTRSIFV